MGNHVSTDSKDGQWHEPHSPLAREHRRPSITWEETIPIPEPPVQRTVSYRARDNQLYATREEAHQANEVYYLSHPESRSQPGIHRADTNATFKSVKTVYAGPMPEDAIEDDDTEADPLAEAAKPKSA